MTIIWCFAFLYYLTIYIMVIIVFRKEYKSLQQVASLAKEQVMTAVKETAQTGVKMAVKTAVATNFGNNVDPENQ